MSPRDSPVLFPQLGVIHMCAIILSFYTSSEDQTPERTFTRKAHDSESCPSLTWPSSQTLNGFLHFGLTRKKKKKKSRHHSSFYHNASKHYMDSLRFLRGICSEVSIQLEMLFLVYNINFIETMVILITNTGSSRTLPSC